MDNSSIEILLFLLAILLYPIALSFLFNGVIYSLESVLIYNLLKRRNYEVLEKIGTFYHELTHAIMGLPFLIIPYRIVFWNKGRDKFNLLGSEYTPAGYVKQFGIGIQAFWGGYFVGAAPMLMSLFFCYGYIHYIDIENTFISINDFKNNDVTTAARTLFTNSLECVNSSVTNNFFIFILFSIVVGFFFRAAPMSIPDIFTSFVGLISIMALFGSVLYVLQHNQDPNYSAIANWIYTIDPGFRNNHQGIILSHLLGIGGWGLTAGMLLMLAYTIHTMILSIFIQIGRIIR